MGSTFSGIEIGKRSIMAHSRSLETTGHNISNASTEGYSRQRVKLKTFEPLSMPSLGRENTPGQIGQGVVTDSIERVHDSFLQDRIIAEGDNMGFWKARDKYILMTEQVYNEPSDTSLRAVMDKFWQGWQDLSLHPDSLSSRQAVLQRGESLMERIHHRFESFESIRTMLDDDLSVSVGEVNGLIGDISRLNVQISKSEAMGDNPNDLKDMRDLKVEQLSEYLPVTVDHRDEDEFLVHTGGLHLVQGKQSFPLKLNTDPLNEGYHALSFSYNDAQSLSVKGGKLGALLELRDGDLKQEIQQMDSLTANFMDQVNEVHSESFGLNGTTGKNFFNEYPFVVNNRGQYDLSGDGVADKSMIFRISGNNRLNAEQQIGLSGELVFSGKSGDVTIAYSPDDTVGDLLKRINFSSSEVAARLDRKGHLELKGTPASLPENPDFVIRSVNDSGDFLKGYSGVLTAEAENGWNWENTNAVDLLQNKGSYAVAPLSHPSRWIEINKDLVIDPASVAAGLGINGRQAYEGDGRAALAIAKLRNGQALSGVGTTYDDYFALTVANIGLKGEISAQSLDTEMAIHKDLYDMKSSLSGVNLDEEMADMIKFQHGYQAASRFVNEMDQMLDNIINRMGV